MALRRSARVNADPAVEKVEPNKVMKRGKAGRTSKSLDTETAASPKRRRNEPLVPPKANRHTDPHQANAPLVSPGTSQVANCEDDLIPSGAKGAGLLPSRITGNILEEACAHLIKVDPTLKHIITKHHCRLFSPEGLVEEVDPFVTLASSIISQQVSGQAARSIKRKFILLFDDGAATDGVEDLSKSFPTPSQVAACDLATLRTAGLSGRKAEYIQGLAQKFASGELSNEMLIKASDEDVMERLIAVRGLGKWSVEMFSCFGLKRMDIFSTGDLGVQRGVAAYMGKDVSKMKAKGGGKWKYMPEKDMLEIASKFAPYRSLFMWYMWRIENVDVEAMQK